MYILDYKSLTNSIFDVIYKFKIVTWNDVLNFIDIENVESYKILNKKDRGCYKLDSKEVSNKELFNIRKHRICNVNKDRLGFIENEDGVLISTLTPGIFKRHKEDYLKLIDFVGTLFKAYKIKDLNDTYVLNNNGIVIKRTSPRTNSSEIAKVVLMKTSNRKEDILTEDEVSSYEIERVILLLDINKINQYKEYVAPPNIKVSVFTKFKDEYISAKSILELQLNIKELNH